MANPPSKYTREICLAAARKCTSLDEFRALFVAEHQAAFRNDWLESLITEVPLSRPECRFTLAECIEAAQPFQTRTEFKHGKRRHYRAANDQGWMDTVCAHMPKRVEAKPRKWTFEECRVTALQYTERNTFRREHPQLVAVADHHGWYPQIIAHMPKRHAFHTGGREVIWTLDACRAEAAKHASRSAFKAHCTGGYTHARTSGWLDDICSHMQPDASCYLRDVYVMRRTGTRMVYIGLSYKPNARHAAHKRRPLGRVREITTAPHTMVVVARRLPPKLAAATEHRLVEHFRANGWDVLNTAKPGALGSARLKWTREKLQAVADQCTTRGDMQRRFNSAHVTACARGLLDCLFERHPNRGHGPRSNRNVKR